MFSIAHNYQNAESKIRKANQNAESKIRKANQNAENVLSSIVSFAKIPGMNSPPP
jgi:cell division protein ZapA (FtsZ GTPase activity inhibitor)